MALSAGQKVTELLQAKVGQSSVRCETKATDQYSRKVRSHVHGTSSIQLAAAELSAGSRCLLQRGLNAKQLWSCHVAGGRLPDGQF